jgi:4-amino-4-deoxy-L-arabinose transferase-like glycosyltransferase
LPSFLATILAVYSTWRLARQWYNLEIANWSALILASTQAYFLFNSDVKTDNLLTAMIIFAIWQLSSYLRTAKIRYLIAGFAGIGLAMLAKGPIGFVLPVTAIGGHLLLKRDWKMIFNFRWLLGIPIIFMVLTPFLWGLHQQWGWHGIKFFFWTQSFGRITGESDWSNDLGPFFLVHTFLWAFIPWTICSLFAFFMSLREIIKNRFRLSENTESISISGFLIIFIALSMSRYKLPHYIFVVFPLAAVFTARWIYNLQVNAGKAFKWLGTTQTVVYMLLGFGIISVLWIVFAPVNVLLLSILMIVAITTTIVSGRSRSAYFKIIMPGVLCIVSVNIGLNYGFYPRLLKYQVSNQAGIRIYKDKIPLARLYSYGAFGSHSLNYYSRGISTAIFGTKAVDSLASPDLWLYTDSIGLVGLSPSFIILNDVKDYGFVNYPVQRLTLDFLNPATRNTVTQKMYLLHIEKKQIHR